MKKLLILSLILLFTSCTERGGRSSLPGVLPGDETPSGDPTAPPNNPNPPNNPDDPPAPNPGDHDGFIPDQDYDGVPDTIDTCISVPNPEQIDDDNDGLGAECDYDDNDPDWDNDGVIDGDDNCPMTANSDQDIADGTDLGIDCDPHYYLDDDNDTIANGVDNCPNIMNFDQVDTDNDGLGNPCDIYPHNPDFDDDGYLDGSDNCPWFANPEQEDNDADGIGYFCDDDRDNDGVPNNDSNGDPFDNCPLTYNPGQENFNSDIDNVGDACDNLKFRFGVERIEEKFLPSKYEGAQTGRVDCTENRGIDSVVNFLIGRKDTYMAPDHGINFVAYLDARCSALSPETGYLDNTDRDDFNVLHNDYGYGAENSVGFTSQEKLPIGIDFHHWYLDVPKDNSFISSIRLRWDTRDDIMEKNSTSTTPTDYLFTSWGYINGGTTEYSLKCDPGFVMTGFTYNWEDHGWDVSKLGIICRELIRDTEESN